MYIGNMQDIESITFREIQRLFQEWLVDSEEMRFEHRGEAQSADFVAEIQGRTVVFEVRRNDDVAALDRGVHQLESHTRDVDAVPVLVVPFMGPKARTFMNKRGVSWLDLSGNADIQWPGTRIFVQGKPNRFATPGRPATAFSPKASRISRTMLVEPERLWLQAELVDATRLSAGYVSKVTGRLQEDELVERVNDGRIRPRDPTLLLDAWSQAYDFKRHSISRCHAVGRTGADVLKRIASVLDGSDHGTWAATGLAAAWQLDHYADFRLVTIFLSRPLLEPGSLGLRPVERGENVWVVVPKDEGVFHGSVRMEGIRCVHPVQVYLDLSGHPERAKEAAAHLRSRHLGWRD